jgi:signal transduction histidine kinase
MAARGLRLEHVAEAGLPPVIANEKAVESVLLNLLLNAADATPAGGTVRVRVRQPAASTTVEVVVEDSGPGIPDDLRQRIFEPFFTTKGDGQGTGLGLTVCRSIVERLDGKIGVQGSELGGAAFVVQFPVQVAEEVS